MGRTAGAALLVAVIVAGLSTVAPRVTEALADMDRFRVRSVEIEGMRYLDRGDVEAALALPTTASVWDDPEPWAERLEDHPMIRDARVRRRLPSTLVVRLEERAPVALLAAATLEPVDAEGHALPLDPTVHPLDLPLLRVPGDAARPVIASGRAARGTVDGPAVATPTRPVRVLAGEAARLAETDPAFAALLSELEWQRRDAVTARWGDPAVALHFHAPLSAHRIREAMAVLADATARNPGRPIRAVDLRFADQVVVRFADARSF